jgi:hypothetical protein
MVKLSTKATFGLLFEVVVGILDHLHVREPLLIWGLFAFGLILLSDSIARGEWADKIDDPKKRRTHRIAYGVLTILAALCFGLWVHAHLHPTEVAETKSESRRTTAAMPSLQSLPQQSQIPSKGARPPAEDINTKSTRGDSTRSAKVNVKVNGNNNTSGVINQNGNDNVAIVGALEPVRARLAVEQVTIGAEGFGPRWLGLRAHIRGYNRSQTPTSSNPIVQAGIKICAPIHSAEEEKAVLFDDPSLWVNETFFKLSPIESQQPFEFTKRQNIPILDEDLAHPDKEAGLRAGNLIVYVVTKSYSRDKYGTNPEDRTCWPFRYDQRTNRFLDAGNCLLTADGYASDH